MKPQSDGRRTHLAVVDAMLADTGGQPRIEPSATLHARTMDAIRRDASAPVRSRSRADHLTSRLWGLAYGTLGVGVTAAAWLFVFQILSVSAPAPKATDTAVRRASFETVANLDERLFNESRSAAQRIATAVNATYAREIEAMRSDARLAAEKAANYARSIAPVRDADGQPLTPEP